MGNFKSLVAFAFIAFFSLSAYSSLPVLSTITEHNNCTKMADNWILARHHNRGRGNQRGGGRGGRAGRPLIPVLEQRPPGSPIVNTISVQHGVHSTDDNFLNMFVEVLIPLLLIASHCITVVLAHVKHARCGFISKIKTTPLRLSESKQKKRQDHIIHRSRLFRAAPIFFLIIITDTIVLATNNTNLHERKDTFRLGLVTTPFDPQIPVFLINNLPAIITTTNTNVKLSSPTHNILPLISGLFNIAIKKHLQESRNQQTIVHRCNNFPFPNT
jgi:hypothetical protein